MLESKTVTNGPIADMLQRVCHDTLPWLISFSLDGEREIMWDAFLHALVTRSLSLFWLVLLYPATIIICTPFILLRAWIVSVRHHQRFRDAVADGYSFFWFWWR